jgi:hypothetical protein
LLMIPFAKRSPRKKPPISANVMWSRASPGSKSLFRRAVLLAWARTECRLTGHPLKNSPRQTVL